MLFYVEELFSFFDLTFMSLRMAHLRDRQSNSRVTQYESALQSAASSGFARFAARFTLALAVIIGLAAASLPAAAGKAPAEFIRILGEQVLVVMRSNAPATQKEAYFHQMLRQDFDLDGIFRFVLGPYWRVASAEQRQQFRSLLA